MYPRDIQIKKQQCSFFKKDENEKNILIGYLTLISYFILTVPVIIFLIGYVKPTIYLVAICILLLIYIVIFNQKKRNNILFIDKNNSKDNRLCTAVPLRLLFRIIGRHRNALFFSAALSLSWLSISSIGGIGYRHFDSSIIEARFWHITNETWPIWFNAEDLGLTEDKPFVFYFAYYLPASLVGKIWGWTAGNLALFCWAWLCLFVIFSLVILYTSVKKRKAFVLGLVVILFGGLDFAFNYFFEIIDDHSEMWSMPFFFFSNTRSLFWSPHHCLPIWLFGSILLHVRSLPSRILSLIPIPLVSIILWSPLCFISLFPFTIILLVYILKKRSDSVLILSSSLSLFLLFILCSFILSNELSFPIEWAPGSFPDFWNKYPVFLVVELAAPILIIVYGFKKLSNFEKQLVIASLLSLLVIPFVRIGLWNDWCIKNAIAPLFFISIITGLVIIRSVKFNFLNFLMLSLLSISFLTSIEEINSSIQNFQISFSEPASFGQFGNGYLIDQQIGSPDSFFVKYIGIQRKN